MQLLCQWPTTESRIEQSDSGDDAESDTLQPDWKSLLPPTSKSNHGRGAPSAFNPYLHETDDGTEWDCYFLTIKHRKLQWLPTVNAVSLRNDEAFANLVEQISVTIHRLHLFQQLQSESWQDPLTKLFNRRYMMTVLNKLLKRVNYGHYQVGFIMMDIDHFKQLNDTFGHDAGDKVLSIIGLFFKGHARPNDVMCRYGGEEFALILPDITLEVLERRANQLCRGVRYLNLDFHKVSLNITLSAGYAIAPIHGSTPATLIKAADNALYIAKREGRDRTVGASVAESASETD